jgi:hypothetical protein
MISKNKGIRGLCRGRNELKWDYISKSNLVNDENGDVLADSHNILNRWMNYFFQLLNVHSVSDVRQIEIHTAEPLYLIQVPMKLKILPQGLKVINRQAVIKFRQI